MIYSNDLSTLPSIAKHASQHGIVPIKRYGQNFIFDSSLCDKIVRVSGLRENDSILEVGPGTAGLTRAILSYNPKSLTVVETDARCIPLLTEIRESERPRKARGLTVMSSPKGCHC